MSLAGKAMEYFVDFVISQPSLEQMAAFTWPDAYSEALGELLEKNSEDILTMEEKSELGMISMLNHLGRMLSAKAKLKLKESDISE